MSLCGPGKPNRKLVSQGRCGGLSSPPQPRTTASYLPPFRWWKWNGLHSPHLSFISLWDHSRKLGVIWLKERSCCLTHFKEMPLKLQNSSHFSEQALCLQGAEQAATSQPIWLNKYMRGPQLAANKGLKIPPWLSWAKSEERICTHSDNMLKFNGWKFAERVGVEGAGKEHALILPTGREKF